MAQNFGTNVDLNKQLAGATGYTGDFGGGQYASWLSTQGKDVQDKSAALTSNTGSGGIIGKQLDNGATTYKADTSTYDPTLRTVDAAHETVAGQLSSILGSGSQYIQKAQADSLATANSRGLINSSMAAGAGTAAAIDKALPIATSDANTYTTASRDNQGFSNNAGQFNAGAKNTANLNEANAANTSELSSQQTGQQKEIIGAQETAQSTLQQEGATQTADQSRLNAMLQTGLVHTQEEAQSRLQAEKAYADAGLSAQQFQQSANLLTQQGQQTAALQQQASDQKIQQLLAAGQQDQALQVIKGNQAVQLANIEATYKDLMQTSASAGQMFTQVSKNITDILADPNTSVEQKQTAVNNQSALLQSSLAVLGGIGNVDIASLLDFTATAGGTTTGSTSGTTTTTDTSGSSGYEPGSGNGQ